MPALVAIVSTPITLGTTPATLPRIMMGIPEGHIAQLIRVRYSIDNIVAAKEVHFALAWTGNLGSITGAAAAFAHHGLFLQAVIFTSVTATGSDTAWVTKSFETDIALSEDPYAFFMHVTAAAKARMEIEYEIRRASQRELLALKGQGGWNAART